LPRFGIVYLNYAAHRRIPNAPARWYADIIAARRGFGVPERLRELEAAEG